MSRLAQAKIDHIKSLYPAYLRREIMQKDIAKRVGCSPAAVRYHTVYKDKGVNGFLSFTESEAANVEHRRQNPQNKSLSALVIEGLNELDITGAELARRLGVSRQAVYKYAKGETMPKKDVLLKMCEIFGIPYIELDRALKRHYRPVA
jgi:transcriptional regulator with XRE-family HTH domain